VHVPPVVPPLVEELEVLPPPVEELDVLLPVVDPAVDELDELEVLAPVVDPAVDELAVDPAVDELAVDPAVDELDELEVLAPVVDPAVDELEVLAPAVELLDVPLVALVSPVTLPVVEVEWPLEPDRPWPVELLDAEVEPHAMPAAAMAPRIRFRRVGFMIGTAEKGVNKAVDVLHVRGSANKHTPPFLVNAHFKFCAMTTSRLSCADPPLHLVPVPL